MSQPADSSPMATVANQSNGMAHNANVTLLLLAGGGLAGLISMATHSVPFGKGFEMVALAQNLAFHGAYANPFPVLATGATAANPPLYPFLLSLIFRIFRSENLVLLVATFASILANAVTALLLPRISLLFYRDIRPGIAAAVLWIFASYLLPSWDAGFVVPILLIFCMITAETIQSPRFVVYAILSGLLAAALFLFNPASVLIFVPWIVFIAYRHRASVTRTVISCCLVFVILIAAGAVWGFRNQQQLGKFVIRTNLGMTLYASDNDCAHASMLASEANNCYQAHHPNTSIREAKLLQTLGEVGYDRLRISTAKDWMRTHHAAFLRLFLARIRDFWFPVPGEHPFKAFVIWTATLLSIPGLILMIKRRLETTPFILFVLLIYPTMYYIVVSDVRYRLPVLWLSLLPAGFFLVQISLRRKSTTA